MRKIVPYRSKSAAISSLDNGGRFYNLLTHASDGEVTPAELAKVAGVFSDRQQMHLFLEMAMCELDDVAEKDVLSMLTPELYASYLKFRPLHMTPAYAAVKGAPSASAIITGIPTYMESCADFNGFIMIPINTGKTMTMVMVPLIDHYDVYEIRSETSDASFLVAHTRGQRRLSSAVTRFGGIVKKLQPKKKGEKPKHRVFLETLYYTERPKRLGR